MQIGHEGSFEHLSLLLAVACCELPNQSRTFPSLHQWREMGCLLLGVWSIYESRAVELHREVSGINLWVRTVFRSGSVYQGWGCTIYVVRVSHTFSQKRQHRTGALFITRALPGWECNGRPPTETCGHWRLWMRCVSWCVLRSCNQLGAVSPSFLLGSQKNSRADGRYKGKTSLLCVFATGEPPNEFVSPVFQSYVADVELDGRRRVEIALWDTVDLEDYDRLRPLSYSNSHVILICYAIDTPESLKSVMERAST